MADRGNHRLNCEIERHIAAWHGTVHGYQVKHAYENDVPYEVVCELAGIEFENYEEE